MAEELSARQLAEDQESEDRECAFLPDALESICGVAVLPMSLRHLSILRLTESPFIVGGLPTAVDVARFLWIVSPIHRPISGVKDKVAHLLFTWRLRGLDFVSSVTAIRAYIDAAMADSPPQGDGNGKAYFSFSASIVDLLGAEYGWTPEVVARLPLKATFQLVNRIRRRGDPKACLFNRSEKIKSPELLRLDAEARAMPLRKN